MIICKWLHRSIVIMALLLAALTGGCLAQSSYSVRGHALYYSPGGFELVAAHRHMTLRHNVAGYASVPSCSHIGEVVYASINNDLKEAYQVLDCSQPRAYARHIREGLVIEIDYASAVRHRFAGEGRAPAVVYYSKP